MRVKLIIEYDGTNYAGWQIQDNGKTIQQTLEQAILTSTGQTCRVHGAGRTDAGVHALGQCAHIDIQTSIPAEKLCYVLNLLLPEDIRIKSSCQVSPEFHSRFNAKAKHYRYTIYCADHACAINRSYVHHVRDSLSVSCMKAALSNIKGTHDFAAFQSAGSSVQTTTRTIYSAELTAAGGTIVMDIMGNGFLYNMVRIIAGTLIEVGRGKLPTDCFETAFKTLDRNVLGPTAPAKGLTLVSVLY